MTRDQRGAVSLELLIGYAPVLLFFAGTLQLADVAAAHLIVQRAAGAATRAAAVVIPDDDVFYEGTDLSVGDQKLADIERAADTVLRATHRLDASGANVALDVQVAIEHDADRVREPVTARVRAEYRCFTPVFCGVDGRVTLNAEATLPLQGARYRYASEGS